MTLASTKLSGAACPTDGWEENPPAWVGERLGLRHSKTDVAIRVTQGQGFALVSACARINKGNASEELEGQAQALYAAVIKEVEGLGEWHPVRFWNHVPGINDRVADGRDRYMVFNAGRYRVLSGWLGGAGEFSRQLATATAVGTFREELVVHCLVSETSGAPVANPRQVPPFEYSKRFGPLPPCFARATVVRADGKQIGLIGGTASIRGEESLHVGNVAQQTEETLVNLTAIAQAAGAVEGLDAYRDMRAYVPRLEDAGWVAQRLRETCVKAGQVEVVQAELCRPELLVEIEGIVELSGGA